MDKELQKINKELDEQLDKLNNEFEIKKNIVFMVEGILNVRSGKSNCHKDCDCFLRTTFGRCKVFSLAMPKNKKYSECDCLKKGYIID